MRCLPWKDLSQAFLQSAEDLVIYICLLNSLCCLWLPMLRRKLPPEYLAYLLKIYLCFVCVSEVLVLIILILLIVCFGYGMRNRYKRCYFLQIYTQLSQHWDNWTNIITFNASSNPTFPCEFVSVLSVLFQWFLCPVLWLNLLFTISL